jgi:hypothetical protein
MICKSLAPLLLLSHFKPSLACFFEGRFYRTKYSLLGTSVLEQTTRNSTRALHEGKIEMQTERTPSPALLESLQAIAGVSEVAQQNSLLQVKVDGEQVAMAR